MSLGQWLFVHAEWASQRVLAVSSVDDSDPPPFLEVQTDDEDPGFVGSELGNEAGTGRGAEGTEPKDEAPLSGANWPSSQLGVAGEEPTPFPEPPPLGLRDSVIFNRQAQRVTALENQVDALTGELQACRHTCQEALGKLAHQQSTLLGLTGRLDTAERLLASVVAAQGDEGDRKAFIASVQHALFNPQGELGALRSQIKSLQTRFDSEGAIECHGVHFGSKTEMASWFEKNGLTIGIFCDAVGLLHTIQAPVVHQAEATKTMESQQKVSISTDLEAAIITSFSTILPSILVGNKKEGTGGTFDWLKGYLKDYSVWDPAGRKSGVSSRIRDGIKVATKRAEGLLALTTDDIEAVKVASGLMSDSCTFITSLCTWIESSHRELTADTPYTSSEVWDMQLECLEQIFEELHQARVAVVDAARLSQGIYLWGMLKAWQIQQRYVRNDFQDDPALTGIFVRRVLLHGQDVSLDERLSKLADGLKKADDHNRQTASDTKQLQREVKELNAAVKFLKTKIDP
jgi:hypothetical protein